MRVFQRKGGSRGTLIANGKLRRLGLEDAKTVIKSRSVDIANGYRSDWELLFKALFHRGEKLVSVSAEKQSGADVSQRRLMRLICAFLQAAIGLAFTLGARPAQAVLGENAATIEKDRRQLMGQLRTISGSGYTVHEIVAPDGTKVREYVGPDGTVFGVSWRGPHPPNLFSLLGSYYTEFRDNAAQAPVRLHASVVRTPNLVVETGGPMGAYWGRAIAPGLIPQGVSEDQIQ